ncbi:MAG: hypothetical protein MJ119_03345 [Lachnospiraceae bacterium]|nr:hypothetical protein [Lachnospiraceae bacterium]
MKGIAFKVKRVISLVLSVALVSGMILNLPITSSAVSTPVSEDESKNETVAEKEIIEETPEVKEEESLVAVEVAEESEEQGEESEEVADIEEDEVVADEKVLSEPDGDPGSGEPEDPEDEEGDFPDIADFFDVTYNYAFATDNDEKVTFAPIKEIKAKEGAAEEYTFKYSLTKNGASKNDECPDVTVSLMDENVAIYVFVTDKDKVTEEYESKVKLYSTKNVNAKNNSTDLVYTGENIEPEIVLDLSNDNLPKDLPDDYFEITGYSYAQKIEDTDGTVSLGSSVSGDSSEVVLLEPDAGKYEVRLSVKPTYGESFKTAPVEVGVGKAKRNMHFTYNPKDILTGETLDIAESEEKLYKVTFTVVGDDDEKIEDVEYSVKDNSILKAHSDILSMSNLLSYKGEFDILNSGFVTVTAKAPETKNYDVTTVDVTANVYRPGTAAMKWEIVKGIEEENNNFVDTDGNIISALYTDDYYADRCIRWKKAISVYSTDVYNMSTLSYSIDSILCYGKNGELLETDQFFKTEEREEKVENTNETKKYIKISAAERLKNTNGINESKGFSTPVLTFDTSTGEIYYTQKYNFYYIFFYGQNSLLDKVVINISASNKQMINGNKTSSLGYMLTLAKELPADSEDDEEVNPEEKIEFYLEGEDTKLTKLEDKWYTKKVIAKLNKESISKYDIALAKNDPSDENEKQTYSDSITFGDSNNANYCIELFKQNSIGKHISVGFMNITLSIDTTEPEIATLSYGGYEPIDGVYYYGRNKEPQISMDVKDATSGVKTIKWYLDETNLDKNPSDDYIDYRKADEKMKGTTEYVNQYGSSPNESNGVLISIPYDVEYTARLFVEVFDAAGNMNLVIGEVVSYNGKHTKIVSDNTAPICDILLTPEAPDDKEDYLPHSVEDVDYYKCNVKVNAYIYEKNFFKENVHVFLKEDDGEEIELEDLDWKKQDTETVIDGVSMPTYFIELTLSKEVKYSIRIEATDYSGNEMESVKTSKFVIDKTAPEFSLDLTAHNNEKSIYKKPTDDGNAEAGETPTQKETNDDITYYYGASEPSNGGVVATMEIVEKNFFPEDVKVVLENEKGEYTVLNLYNTEEEPAVNYWKTSTKKSDPDSGSDSNTDTDPDSNTDTDPDSNTDTDPDSNPNPDPNSNPNPDPDSNLNPDPDANSGTNSLMGNIINGISNFVMRRTDGQNPDGNGGNSGNGGNTPDNGGGNNDTPDEIVNTCKIALFVPDDFARDDDTFAKNVQEGKYRIKVVYSDRSGNAMCGKEDDPGMLTWQTTVTNPETQEKESVEESGYATPHLVLDITAPKVKITYSGASSKRSLKGFADSQNTYTYYAGTLNGTVTVQEENFDTEDSSLYKFKFAANSVSGGDAGVSLNECISKWSPSADMYTMACTFKNDANYTFGFEKLADLAGNVAVLPKPDYFTVDKTNPKITEIKYSTPVLDTVLNAVTFGFYNAKVTVSVTAEDATAGVHEFNYSYTNAAGVSGVNASLSNQIVSEGNIKYSNDHSKATLTFTIPKDALDSNHQFNGTVKVSVKDRSDNSAAREDNKRIVVDTIAPTATVSYNAPVNERGDKFYYASDITGTVTINEANFYATDVVVTVSKNGSEGSVLTTSWTDQSTDVHVGHFTLSEEGEYIVRINYKDKSTNTMTEYVSGLMVIDKTIDEPVFKINGVEKSGDMGGAYKDELNVSYSFNDTNYNASEVKLTKISFAQKDDVTATYIKTTETSNGGNGTFDIAKAVDTDGIYLLEISMSDLAGHSIEQYVKFTANRYGSVFEYSDYLVWLISDGGQYVKLNGDEAITENLVITEYNPDRVENGSLSITATRDGEAVPVDYTTVESEINRSAEQTPNGWFTYIYTIDKANFIEDGHYKISISSSDATGNTTTSVPDNSFDAKGNKILDIMSFTVDTTNPEIRNIINLDSSVINAQTLEVKYSLLDLGGLKSVEAYVDGKPVETALDLEQGSNNYNGSFILNDSPEAQEVRLVIEDLAGNVTDTDDSTWKDEQVRAGSYVFKNPVTVSTNLMVLWLANKFAFFGSIGLVTVLVIGGVVFVVARKKRY